MLVDTVALEDTVVVEDSIANKDAIADHDANCVTDSGAHAVIVTVPAGKRESERHVP
jgi:hypothetical protein